MVFKTELIPFALGKEKPELVLKNAQIINVFSGEIYQGDIAVHKGYIVGIGDYTGRVEMDLAGRIVSPGFIDGHVHIESSMVTPSEFSKAVVPHGTTTAIIDPHEIANVAGLAGIKYMLQASDNLPLDVYMMLPSCVPATDLETSGAVLLANDLAILMDHPRVLGLGEVMNFPGVLANEKHLKAKLELFKDKIIDGHSPGLQGKELCGYTLAGIKSDHECTTVGEALARLQLGMYVMIREGSATKNLRQLVKAVNKNNVRRFMFVTDDRHPEDLLAEGHIDHLIRLSIEEGLDLVTAIRIATLNPAEYFGLKDRGAIAPGYKADLVVLDPQSLKVINVFKDGEKVGEGGVALFQVNNEYCPEVRNTVKVGLWNKDVLKIPASSGKARVMEIVPQQIITKEVQIELPIVEGFYELKNQEDICKLVVVERHKATGNVGLALVKDFGLIKGAIASSVGHDSHNIVAIGRNDEDIGLAVAEVIKLQGGLAIASEKKILGSLALPVGGIMSDKSLVEVRDELAALRKIATNLGVKADYDPFMTLAFLTLPVIPKLKLTDHGLVDVEEFKIVPISV